MIKNIRYIIVASILIISNIFATGGSVYSRFGLGDLIFSNSARQLGLGGLGYSLYDKDYLNLNNPGSWTVLNNVKFSIGLISNLRSLSDGQNSAFYSNTNFSGFELGFPLEKELGLSLVLGLSPYSFVNYETKEETTDIEFGKLSQLYSGGGSLSKFFFGLSYKLPFDISFGATLNYYVGDINYKSSLVFEDLTNFTNANYNEDNKYRGMGTTIGLISPDLSTLLGLNNFSNLRLAVSYEWHGKLNSNVTLSNLTSIGEINLTTDNYKIQLPNKFNMGLTFNFDNNYLFIFDFFNQPWGEFSQKGLSNIYFKDLNIYSLGFEYSQTIRKYATFWELVKYRFGLSYEMSQYSIKNNDIDQYNIHTGISFPLGIENSIDLGFMYGIRGTNNFNIVKENIFKASVTLNFGELWFIRSER